MLKVVENPDKELVAEIRKKLKENDNHCPCRLQKTPDTMCMCKDFRDMIINKQPGECHCGLYCIVNEE